MYITVLCFYFSLTIIIWHPGFLENKVIWIDQISSFRVCFWKLADSPQKLVWWNNLLRENFFSNSANNHWIFHFKNFLRIIHGLTCLKSFFWLWYQSMKCSSLVSFQNLTLVLVSRNTDGACASLTGLIVHGIYFVKN